MKNWLLAFALLFVGAKTQAQTIVYHENFETADSVTASGNPAWASNTTYQVSGLKSYRNSIAINDTSWLTTDAFSTVGNSFVILNFNQICKIEFFDAAIIEVSNDNGVTWTRLTGTEYLGTAPFAAQGNKFTAASYIDWVPGNNTAVPANTWWKNEGFDASAYIGNAAQCKLRFKLHDANGNGANSNYGWLIDDISVVAAPSELNPPVITYMPPLFLGNVYNLGPFAITTDITDQTGIASATVYYTVNNGAPQQVSMSNTSGNTWVGNIPAVTDSDTVCYYVQAIDASTAANSAINPISGCRTFITYTGITFPFIDNFDGASSLWTDTTVGSPTSNWELGTPNYNLTNSAHSAPNAWDVNLNSAYTDNASCALISPVFDFSTTVNAKMSFWHNWDSEPSFDGMRVDYTTDGGNTWSVLGTANDPNGTNWYNNPSLASSSLPGWDGNSGGWVKSEYKLSILNNVVGAVQFRFVFRSDPSVTYSGYSIDDFQITPPFPYDASATAVITPDVSSCVAQGTATVSFSILNDGQNTLTGPFNVTYVLDNGTPVTEQFTGSILPAVLDTMTFATTYNNAPGTHTLQIYVSYPNDSWHVNDTLFVTYNTAPGVNVPYFDGFETSNSLNDFCLTSTLQGRVALSTSAANTGTQGVLFDATGSNDWDFGTDTITSSQFYVWNATQCDQQRANARLIVNTAGYNDLVLQFDAKLLYSFGNEYTNFRVKVNGQMITPHLQPNNANTPYLQYSYLLTPFLPATSLIIDFESKVAFDAQFSNSGIYMDNLYIYRPDSIDAGVTAITQPGNQTMASTNNSVTVKIKNWGRTTLTSIPVSYQINNNTPVSATWTGSVAPNTFTTYTFTTQYNSPSGQYTIAAWTSVPNDTSLSNDTTIKTVIGMQIFQVPYTNDLEGPVVFAAETTYPNSWELGTPAAPNIVGAYSGTNAWEVNLNGPYQVNSNEFLYSPYFDFSQTTNAELRFWQWYHCDQYSDGGRVEMTLDGGQTWNTLGVAFDPLGTSWYNQSFIGSSGLPGWSGTGGGYFQSKYKLDTLDNFAIPVQFRFVFNSDNFNQGNDGWAIDNFEIFVPIDAATDEIKFGNVSPLPIPGSNNVKIQIENPGVLPLNQVSVTLKIDNNTVVTDLVTFSPALQPGQSQQHQFSQAWTNASPGFHLISCWTSAPNGLPDTQLGNDTTIWNVAVMDTFATYPYCNDFETSANSPLTTMNALRFTNSSNSFVEATPLKNLITAAHSGTKCWITNQALNYLQNDSSGVFLPVFTVDTTNCYHLEFWTNYQTQINHDGGVVEYSYDMGNTWQRMGIAYEPNWYVGATASGLGAGYQPNFGGTSGAWIKVEHDYRFAQAGPVIIRLRFGADNSIQTDGWAIDDICFSRIPPCVLSIEEQSFDNGMTLDQNVPNPAAQSTTIQYSIPENGQVVLRLTNTLGQEVMTQSSTEQQGLHTWEINVSQLPEGVYFYEINFGTARLVRKLVVSH